MIRFALCLALVLCSSQLNAAGWGHRLMVASTGIRPANIGAYEGVGRSSRSHADAIANACYAGQREAVSVQLSTTRNRRGQVMYNAVVRYR